MFKRYFIAALVLSLLLTVAALFGWLVYYKPAFKGKVIDAETKEPIEGAVVVVIYRKNTLGPFESYISTFNARETLTDKNGVFYFYPYLTIINPLSWSSFASFIIYKPGYGNYPNFQIEAARYIVGKDEQIFFKRSNFGKERDIETLGKYEVEVKKIMSGVVELPELKTWEERNKANMISLGDIPKSKWPILNEMIKKEDEWLKTNRGWRR